jgi:hypothetical protein
MTIASTSQVCYNPDCIRNHTIIERTSNEFFILCLSYVLEKQTTTQAYSLGKK